MVAKLAAALLILSLAMPAMAQTSTPAPTVPVELANQMATAAAQSNELPSDISRPANHQAVVPSADATPLFSYIKWLFSLNTAQELLGPTLAPLGIQLFIIMTIVILLAGLYLVVNLITIIIRFVIWILTLIWKLLQLIPFI
jgi:hypothetical protein